MGWLRKKKDKKDSKKKQLPDRSFPQTVTPLVSSKIVSKLSPEILDCIFSFICPHVEDRTLENCENSALEERCMPCDLRDLSYCSRVSKKWRVVAVNLMYQSIRIDPVHFCPLEDIIMDKLQRKHRFSANAEPPDIPLIRLRLLYRSLNGDQRPAGARLGEKVQYFKTSYMLRENSKPEHARVVALCPNLKYIDLPIGVYRDDQSCDALRAELQGNCADLRKMCYMSGGERGLELLAGGAQWTKLEVIELTNVHVDVNILRQALGGLRQLRAMKISDMISFTDEAFAPSEYLPPFPALVELVLEQTRKVTADGLAGYLFRSDVQNSLKTLSLKFTGVKPFYLYKILTAASKLEFLSITEEVSKSFPVNVTIPPLKSSSLEIFHYEITPPEDVNYSSITASYYNYLRTSLMANGLANLEELYVRDPDFPESLVALAPPVPAFANDPDNFNPRLSNNPFESNANRFSSNNPFAKMAGSGLYKELQVFSKGLDEMEWNFSTVKPPQRGRRGSATPSRPVSSYGLSEDLNQGWNAQSGQRRSVIVGNGFGGFLAVPANGDRPNSSAGEKGRRGSQYDMWR